MAEKKKTLKMGFAMGGGVSLGSFSGAALSEAIKQAVLNGGYLEKDENGQEQFTQYKNVIVDVFAGASAGSMSLAIMLRGLAHQTDAELAQAENDLIREGIDLGALSKDKQDNLIVAQVVQNLQEKIWVKDINLDKLLGTTDSERNNLINEGGIVRRGALESIANENFKPLEEAYVTDFPRRKILADEVIFGSTLSNLTGVINDSREKEKDNLNFQASFDAYTSACHKELRVFHLFFTKENTQVVQQETDNYPSQWVRYHMGKKKKGVIGDIRSKNAWARMVSTSMACGAFPFAFEPVPLERFKFEYQSCWPKELTSLVCQYAMELEKPPTEEELSYPFTYVDGGTFNNEPVREAFRMANFLDCEDQGDFDRVIVFVDPSIAGTETNYRVPVLQQYSLKEPRLILGNFDGYDLVRKGTLDRLLPHIGTLVSMIVDEGRVNENDKIKNIQQLFEDKNEYYKIFEELLINVSTPAQAVKISRQVQPLLKKILDTEKVNTLLPMGAISLYGEIIRVRKEHKIELSPLENITRDQAEMAPDTMPEDMKLPYLKALLYVFMDLMLDLAGKSPGNKIIALAPVMNINGEEHVIQLPGGPLEAFSGFASRKPNLFAGNMAKYCTRLLMKNLKMLPANFNAGAKPEWSKQDQEEFIMAFKAKLVNINARIDNLFHESHLIELFPGIDNFVLTQISNVIKNKLAELSDSLTEERKQSFQFKVEVQNKRMELDGKDRFNDGPAIMVDGKLCLYTELTYYPDRKTAKWNGIHEQDGFLIVDIDGRAFLGDNGFCKIALPDDGMLLVANLLPNPVFTFKRSIEDSDEGKTLDAANWTPKPGLRLPERTLLD